MAQGKRVARLVAFGAVVAGAVLFWRKRRGPADDSLGAMPGPEETTTPS
jgi:hypothetical protein